MAEGQAGAANDVPRKELDPKTQLPLSPAFFERMDALVANSMNDTRWMLAMTDIDGLKKINEKSYMSADIVITAVGHAIKNICEQHDGRFEAFKDDSTGSGDLFGIIIYCERKSDYAIRNLEVLIQNIHDAGNWSISVGLTYLQTNDTSITWRTRAMSNLKLAKQNGGQQVYWDKHENAIDLQIKSNQLQSKIEGKLKGKNEFDKKINEISGSNDTNWFLCICDGDNIGKLKRENPERADKAVVEIENQIAKMISIYNDSMFAYKWGGDEFTMLLHRRDITGARRTIQELINNVDSSTEVTISIGMARLQRDETGTEWYTRADSSLKKAKENGKNRFYFDNTTNIDIERSVVDEDGAAMSFIRRIFMSLTFQYTIFLIAGLFGMFMNDIHSSLDYSLAIIITMLVIALVILAIPHIIRKACKTQYNSVDCGVICVFQFVFGLLIGMIVGIINSPTFATPVAINVLCVALMVLVSLTVSTYVFKLKSQFDQKTRGMVMLGSGALFLVLALLVDAVFIVGFGYELYLIFFISIFPLLAAMGLIGIIFSAIIKYADNDMKDRYYMENWQNAFIYSSHLYLALFGELLQGIECCQLCFDDDLLEHDRERRARKMMELGINSSK